MVTDKTNSYMFLLFVTRLNYQFNVVTKVSSLSFLIKKITNLELFLTFFSIFFKFQAGILTKHFSLKKGFLDIFILDYFRICYLLKNYRYYSHYYYL